MPVPGALRTEQAEDGIWAATSLTNAPEDAEAQGTQDLTQRVAIVSSSRTWALERSVAFPDLFLQELNLSALA